MTINGILPFPKKLGFNIPLVFFSDSVQHGGLGVLPERGGGTHETSACLAL
jgi:hypothetical protein